MKAVRFHSFGDASVLRYEDVPVPVPGPGEVRLRVVATAFNPVDDGIRGGYLRDAFPVALPHTPGIDVSGIVDLPGDSSFSAGDAVIGFLPMVADGASAEYVIAPASVLTAAPSSLDPADAAALPSVGLTAWQALFELASVEKGQRVLINGAGGAVGSYAVQLAHAAGAYVIAVVRSAVDVPDADEVVVAPVQTSPVDVVLNLAGVSPEEFAALVALIRPGGVVVSTTVWMPAVGDPARDVRAVDVFVRSDAAQLAHLVGLVDDGALRVSVAERVPLADLPSVHARAASLPGKVVVLP